MIAVTMATVMGFSWIFGYLTLVTTDLVFNMVMSVLFAISSSLQARSHILTLPCEQGFVLVKGVN